MISRKSRHVQGRPEYGDSPLGFLCVYTVGSEASNNPDRLIRLELSWADYLHPVGCVLGVMAVTALLWMRFFLTLSAVVQLAVVGLPASPIPADGEITDFNPETSDSVPADRYLSHEEMITWLNGIAQRYPKLAKTFSIGQSEQGRDLLVLELSHSVGRGQRDLLMPMVKLVSLFFLDFYLLLSLLKSLPFTLPGGQYPRQWSGRPSNALSNHILFDTKWRCGSSRYSSFEHDRYILPARHESGRFCQGPSKLSMSYMKFQYRIELNMCRILRITTCLWQQMLWHNRNNLVFNFPSLQLLKQTMKNDVDLTYILVFFPFLLYRDIRKAIVGEEGQNRADWTPTMSTWTETSPTNSKSPTNCWERRRISWRDAKLKPEPLLNGSWTIRLSFRPVCTEELLWPVIHSTVPGKSFLSELAYR